MKSTLIFVTLMAASLLTSCNQTTGNKAISNTNKDSLSFFLSKVWETDTVFRTPESVIFDDINNILYVANINGDPSGKDKRGFISKLDSSGNVVELKWVEGLNGPKGMAISKDTLFVADVNQLALIDIRQGKIISQIDIPGASFLNDLAEDDNGDVYISDSNTGLIHIYSNGKVSTWHDEGLNRPNGLYVEADRVLINNSKSGEVLAIDKNSKESTLLAEGIDGGDGIEYIGRKGHYIVSAWAGEIFIISPQKQVSSILNTKDEKINTADIEFIPSSNLLLVPTFFDNRVVAYRLKMK